MTIQARYIATGDRVDYVADADKSAGDVVVQNDLVGIVVRDIDISEDALGALYVEGVFALPNNAENITVGTDVYWDVDGTAVDTNRGTGCVTATATGNTYLGKAMPAAGAAASDNACDSTDYEVRVKLMQGEVDATAGS